MVLTISREQARHFLVTYHLQQTDLPGVFAHLGTVQYDPLNPVGRNPDLVLQARVPGYRVNDWQQAAYTDRFIYDGWDKQLSLYSHLNGIRHCWLRSPIHSVNVGIA